MYLLFDIGGTWMRFVVSRDGSSFAGEPRMVATPQDFDEALRVVSGLAAELGAGEKFKTAVGGLPGPLNKENSMLLNAPHLPQWIGKPLKEKFAAAISGGEVFFENDAALAALGEATGGAGKGYPIVAYVTVSTGVGGARIVNGKIDHATLGFEIGHQIISLHSGEPITLEAFISGSALEKRYGKAPDKIADAAVWEDVARMLAVGINNTIVHWSPDCVVLGGSVMQNIALEKVEAHLRKIHTIFPELPRLEVAMLGGMGGLYGALALLKGGLVVGKSA